MKRIPGIFDKFHVEIPQIMDHENANSGETAGLILKGTSLAQSCLKATRLKAGRAVVSVLADVNTMNRSH